MSKDTRPITVSTAGQEKLRSSHIGHYPLPLSKSATIARFVKNMTVNLLSVPQLTKTGLHVLYSKNKCYVLNEKPQFEKQSILLKANRNKSNLYDLPIPTSNPIHAYISMTQPSNEEDQIAYAFKMLQTHYSIKNQNQYEANRFWHKCFLAVPTNTLYNAVKNFEDFNFPNLTAEGLRKNWPYIQSTTIGHNRQLPSNRNSTTIKKIKIVVQRLQNISSRRKGRLFADQIGAKICNRIIWWL